MESVGNAWGMSITDEGLMASAKRKTLKSGKVRYYARYKGSDGQWHEEGGFDTAKKALAFGYEREGQSQRGEWVAPLDARTTFGEYVDSHYWPSVGNLEVSTRAGYRSYLDAHFLPALGAMPMGQIAPSTIQGWVNSVAETLSPASVIKYHTFLHGVFARAVVDRVIARNPCADTRLPKVVARRPTIITPAEFDRILEEIPSQHRMLVVLAVETGMRWGEIAALRPSDVDFAARIVTVQRALVEVSRKNSPTGNTFSVKGYPKDDEPRVIQIEAQTCAALREHMLLLGIRDEDLLFSSESGTPLSRTNFRTRVWLPALKAAGLSRAVRFHDIRAAHASWLLAGGADLQVVKERLGHRSITTTERYLGTLPDAGDRALAALRTTRSRVR